MVTFLSFDQQNLIMVNNEVTTIATECYRFCDFVLFQFSPFYHSLMAQKWKKKTIMVFMQHEATRSPPPPLPRIRYWSIAKLPPSISSIFPDNSSLTHLYSWGVERETVRVSQRPCTTHVAFQLGSDKNNSHKSFSLFLGKLSFHQFFFFEVSEQVWIFQIFL